MSRYAVGQLDSFWASEPYSKHRLVLDLSSRTVIAGQDRQRRLWRCMSLGDVDYMQQILDETFDLIWDEPEEFHFFRTDDIPEWATAAWDWPREPPLEAIDEIHESADDASYVDEWDEYGCTVNPPPFELYWR
jgi:hypothetical protein